MALTAIGTALTCTTSFQTVPNLSFTLEAGGVYRFEAYLSFQATASGALVFMQMGGTATATFTSHRIAINTSSTPATSTQTYTAFPSAGASPGALTTGVNLAAVFDGVIDVNAGGTMDVQVKYTTAAGITVNAGGIYLVERIG